MYATNFVSSLWSVNTNICFYLNIIHFFEGKGCPAISLGKIFNYRNVIRSSRQSGDGSGWRWYWCCWRRCRWRDLWDSSCKNFQHLLNWNDSTEIPLSLLLNWLNRRVHAFIKILSTVILTRITFIRDYMGILLTVRPRDAHSIRKFY